MKKIISLLTTAVLLLSSTITVFAQDTYSQDTPSLLYSEQEINTSKQVKLSDELLVEMAQNLLEIYGEEKNIIEVKDLIPIYNINEQLTGYTASYYKENMPYGYVVFDFSLPNYIKEFSIGKDIPSIYQQIKNVSKEKNIVSTFSDDELKIYEGLPLEYSIKYSDNNNTSQFIDNQGEIRDEEDFTQYAEKILSKKTSTYSNNYDSVNIFLNYDQIPHSFTELGSIDTAFSYSEATVEAQTGSYACSISALANICNQSGYLLHNSLKDTYASLWTAAKTKTYKVENGIKYGKNGIDDIGPGIEKYMRDNFGVSVVTFTKENPSFAYLSSVISAPAQSVLAYGILYNGERSGHTITVDGYRVTNTGGHYLQVANGWDSHLVYLNYDTVSFLDSTSMYFNGIPVY